MKFKYFLVMRSCVVNKKRPNSLNFRDIDTGYSYDDLNDAVDKKWAIIDNDCLFADDFFEYCWIDKREVKE